MKLPFKLIKDFLPNNIDLNSISNKLFQLGHENEIYSEIFDIEITPNRGDCLSIDGILRELNVFYDIDNSRKFYSKEIPVFNFNFENRSKHVCPKAKFLKIKVENIDQNYKEYINSYFKDLNIKKNNFFTDISNYLMFETGQPTHCYDYSKINEKLVFETISKKAPFINLFEEEILLDENNHVFTINNEVVNLAGIIGGKKNSCSKITNEALIECAYFDPEEIIGKSIKYNINSDAAYRFERGTDINCHDYVLRRFIQIVQEHAQIKNIEVFEYNSNKIENKTINFNHNFINKILGIELSLDEQINYLNKINFKIDNNKIQIPSYRNDILNQNDLAEELARIIGFNNIPSKKINIPKNISEKKDNFEDNIKLFLIDAGFNEVINDPFVNEENPESIEVDNALDINRKFLRTSLRKSLINNLIYNEKRQNDSIKLFEISDIYFKNKTSIRKIGLICSGRIGKDHKNFSKVMNIKYLEEIFKSFEHDFKFQEIRRSEIDSKITTPVFYLEIKLSEFPLKINKYKSTSELPQTFKKYKKISEYPSIFRDLSFAMSIKDKLNDLDHTIRSFKTKNLKDKFVFDFYEDEVKKVVKIGYRFIFQSNEKTLTDSEVETDIIKLVNEIKAIEGINIPGMK